MMQSVKMPYFDYLRDKGLSEPRAAMSRSTATLSPQSGKLQEVLTTTQFPYVHIPNEKVSKNHAKNTSNQSKENHHRQKKHSLNLKMVSLNLAAKNLNEIKAKSKFHVRKSTLLTKQVSSENIIVKPVILKQSHRRLRASCCELINTSDIL